MLHSLKVERQSDLTCDSAACLHYFLCKKVTSLHVWSSEQDLTAVVLPNATSESTVQPTGNKKCSTLSVRNWSAQKSKKPSHLRNTYRHQNKYKIHTWRGPPEISPLVLDIWWCIMISRGPCFLGRCGTAIYFSQPTTETLFLLCFGFISCVVYARLMTLLPMIKHKEMEHHLKHHSIS